MIKMTEITRHVDLDSFLRDLTQAMTSKAVEALMQRLPIVDEHRYQFDEEDSARGWQEGYLHWVPIGPALSA